MWGKREQLEVLFLLLFGCFFLTKRERERREANSERQSYIEYLNKK